MINGIDVSKLVDSEVLFFIRIRGKASYFSSVYSEKFLQKFSKIEYFRCISEYKKDADEHIDLNSIEKDWLTEDEFSEMQKIIVIEDVIQRCRGLRSITFCEAISLINRCYLYFKRFYQRSKNLKLIVTGAIDNYVMDLMQRIGCHYGVKFIGVTDSFMSPEYKLLTLRGEVSDYITPSELDVKHVYKVLQERMVSPSIPSRGKALRSAIYDFGSYVYRYIFRFSFKYKMLGNLGYEYRFAPFLHKFNSIDKLIAAALLQPINKISFDLNTKYAYIPLHYYPEATTDYWISNKYHVNYMSSLRNTIHILRQNGYTSIIKEHPAFYLARSKKFYKNLISDGAILLDPFISTKEVFDHVNLVVVWNGSTGIEAIIHQKPLVKITNSYYGDDIIPDVISGYILPIKPTEIIAYHVIKKVLATSFKTT